MKFVLALLLIPFLVFSQENYPQDVFQSPLAIPLDISGSFAELRSNHFHSGLDFKTSGVEGLPVFATGDGYVSRIKIPLLGMERLFILRIPMVILRFMGIYKKQTALFRS